MLHRRARPIVLATLPFLGLAFSLAATEGGESKKPAAKSADIEWARSFAEAREESMERNVAMYIHSHGST